VLGAVARAADRDVARRYDGYARPFIGDVRIYQPLDGVDRIGTCLKSGRERSNGGVVQVQQGRIVEMAAGRRIGPGDARLKNEQLLSAPAQARAYALEGGVG